MVRSHQKVHRCLASVIHGDLRKPPWLGLEMRADTPKMRVWMGGMMNHPKIIQTWASWFSDKAKSFDFFQITGPLGRDIRSLLQRRFFSPKKQVRPWWSTSLRSSTEAGAFEASAYDFVGNFVPSPNRCSIVRFQNSMLVGAKTRSDRSDLQNVPEIIHCHSKPIKTPLNLCQLAITHWKDDIKTQRKTNNNSHLGGLPEFLEWTAPAAVGTCFGGDPKMLPLGGPGRRVRKWEIWKIALFHRDCLISKTIGYV